MRSPIDRSRFSPASSLDVLTHPLQETRRFGPGERNRVVLERTSRALDAGGRRSEMAKRLVAFGVAGEDSAMARTVSLPAALACRLILDGRRSLAGVHIPVVPELAEPIWLGLRQRGLPVEETVVPGEG